MNNLYGGTLKIDDGFSITINRFKNSMNGAGSALKKFTSESSRSSNTFRDKWSRSFSDIGRSSDKMTSKMISSLKRVTVAFLSVQSTVKATRKIIEAGINVQNSRMYIDAVFGKSGNALQKFKQAQDFAAKTPFNSVEITNAIAKAQMLGLGTSQADMNKYADLGSIAKLNGSGGIAEAVDAYADMMNGEFERMQTILGIKKRDLEQYAKDNNMGRFTNKQGQITNKDTLKQVFDSYIQSRGITGITEKYSQTLEGRLSTLSDNFKTSLAKIGGIQDDGSVKAGSLFDNFSKGVEQLITSLEKFGNSEAFNVLQDNLGKISGAFISFVDSLTADPEKLQKMSDKIKKFFYRMYDIGKFFADISWFVQQIAKIMLSYKFIIKPIDFLAKAAIGFGPTDIFKGLIGGIADGILLRKGNFKKGFKFSFYQSTFGKKGAGGIFDGPNIEKNVDILSKKFKGANNGDLSKHVKKPQEQNIENLKKKKEIKFNESVFNKAIFNNAKFIGTKNSPFSNDSKKKSKFKVRSDERASDLSRYVKNDLIPYKKHEIKPYHTKIDIKSGIKSGVNSGIKKSGLSSAMNKLSSKFNKLSSNLSTYSYAVASAASIVHSFLSTNGFIHNSINDIGGLLTGNYNKDYAARIYGNGIVKGEAWIANKIHLLSDKDYDYAKKSIDNYIQNSDDYISGKTDKNPNIGRMGNYNPTNNVTVNIDKIEKDVDSDALIDKLSEIMDSWNDRNAIGTPIY